MVVTHLLTWHPSQTMKNGKELGITVQPGVQPPPCQKQAVTNRSELQNVICIHNKSKIIPIILQLYMYVCVGFHSFILITTFLEIFHSLILCTCVGLKRICAVVYVCKSEDSLWESVLSATSIQWVELSSSDLTAGWPLYPLNLLASPSAAFLNAVFIAPIE